MSTLMMLALLTTAAPPRDLFTRDALGEYRVRSWSGEVVLGTRAGWYRLDVDAGKATPLAVLGSSKVYALAQGGGRSAALVQGESGVSLAVGSGGAFEALAVPQDVQETPAAWALGVNARSAVLCSLERCHTLAGKQLASTALAKAPPRPFPGGATRAVLYQGKLVLGFARGEWGGALLAADPATGRWLDAPGFGTCGPVSDLTIGPDGKLWVVEGLAHLGLRDGRLRTWDGATWATVAEVSTGAKTGFDLDATDFEGLAFDAQKRPLLLTGHLGVVRREGARWVRVTPGWPDFAYVDSLVVVGGRALVGALDAGVLVWELGTERATRIRP